MREKGRYRARERELDIGEAGIRMSKLWGEDCDYTKLKSLWFFAIFKIEVG